MMKITILMHFPFVVIVYFICYYALSICSINIKPSNILHFILVQNGTLFTESAVFILYKGINDV